MKRLSATVVAAYHLHFLTSSIGNTGNKSNVGKIDFSQGNDIVQFSTIL